MGQKVSDPATRGCDGLDVEQPTPWQRRPSSSEYDMSHVALCEGWHHSWQCLKNCRVASSRTGIATGLGSLSFAARAANAFVIWDQVCVAIGSTGIWLLVREDRCCTVVQPELSTLGGATGGTTLGGGAVDVAVVGVMICLAVGVAAGCVLVECSSARRASMAASWS